MKPNKENMTDIDKELWAIKGCVGRAISADDNGIMFFTVFLEDEKYNTDFLPKRIQGYNIKYLVTTFITHSEQIN